MARSNKPDPKEFEVPDLELAIPAASSRRGPEPPRSHSGLHSTASDPREEGVNHSSLRIQTGGPEGFGLHDFDLDLDPLPQSAQPAADAIESDFGASSDFDCDFDSFQDDSLPALQAALVPEATVPERRALDWPRGESPPLHELQVDAVEVHLKAGFGDPPLNPLIAPVYTFRILSRKYHLRAELEEQRRRAERSAIARDRLVAELALSLRDTLQKNDRYRALLAPVEQEEATARERSDALSRASESHQDHVGAIELTLEANRELAKAAEARLRIRDDELQASEQRLARISAQYKRLLIEIRGLRNSEEQARDKGLSVDHSARIGAISLEAAQLKPKVEALEQERQQAASRVNEEQRVIERLKREADSADRQKKRLSKAVTGELDRRRQGVVQAEDQRQQAATRAGRSILALRGEIEVDDRTLAAIRQADDRALVDLRALRHIELALESHDAAVYRRGLRLTLVALGLILALIGVRWFGGEKVQNGDEAAEIVE